MKLFFTFILVFLLACGGGSDSSEEESDGGIEPTLSSIQQNIFTPSCASGGCHSSTSASAGLSLAEGESFDNLVGVAATQLLEMNRVKPGDPDNSYLVHKVEGTQSTVGGSGSRMPKDGLTLSDEKIQAIRDWIEAGAENN